MKLKPYMDMSLREWEPYLQKMLDSEYMKELVNYLNELYDKTKVVPNRINIFKAFRLCPHSKLKVVILGKDPYPNSHATGLAFGNPDLYGIKVSPSLKVIQDCVEQTVYGGLNLNFDITLDSWAKQGVLLLNTSLTTLEGSIGAHHKIWAPFTETVIKIISKHNKNIIFLIWGEDAKEYIKFIDRQSHFVLKSFHPSYHARNNTTWNCDHFVETNRIITEHYGAEHCIRW